MNLGLMEIVNVKNQRKRVLALLAILAIAGCATAPVSQIIAPAPLPAASIPASIESTEAARSTNFSNWVADFRSTARASGIDEATLHSAFDQVQFLPRVVGSDQAQPEFTRSVWDYLDSAVSAQRIARGQEKLQQWRPQLDAVAARYGVPAEVLVAIWGIESNFGTHAGDIPTIDALATLGFEGRREAWARGQLLAALKILQNGDIGRDKMVGSWAGAMGQTQFLPSVFLAHAVDADGDGRRDIWASVPDVMASTANFLAHSGWPWWRYLSYQTVPSCCRLARAGRRFWWVPTFAPSCATTMPPVMRWRSICWPSGWPTAPRCRLPGRAIYRS